MFKIEKNIEIPRARSIGRKLKYPILEMEIGDSFLVENRREANTAANSGRKLGLKFVTRTLEKGVRIWRVA